MNAPSTAVANYLNSLSVSSPSLNASMSTLSIIGLVPLRDALTNINVVAESIEIALTTIPKNVPGKQELTIAVRASVAGTQELLSGVTLVTVDTKACVDNLYRRLQEIHEHLQDRSVYGKRAQLKALFGRPSTPLPIYHLQIQEAFHRLKDTLAVAEPPTPEFISSREASQSRLVFIEEGSSSRSFWIDESFLQEGALEASAPDPPETNGWRSAAVDGIEVALHVLSDTTSFMPSTAGSIVKLMAGTGLIIIEMLKNVKENGEQAMELGRHIGTLIQIAGRFLETPRQKGKGSGDEKEETVDEQTITQLGSFLDALKTIEKALARLNAQGRLQRGISHKSNKDDLKKWDDMINRAFAALQTQLSLHSLRILTTLTGADAHRERDRLLGLLGDGDIGATEKAADPADLMCLPGTRADILNEIDWWIVDPHGSRVFWISGVAGCGKSAVAATIAGRERIIPTSTAVFYFSRGNQERNKRVVCSLSRQLARLGHNSLERFILRSVQANSDIATSHLTTQFRALVIDPLKKLVSGLLPVILVIDALDEWDNHGAVLKLIDLIKQAHAELPPTVRFVLTSRNEHHLVKSLESDAMQPLITRYPLDAVLRSEAGRDIRQYIEMRFTKMCAESGVSSNGGAWPEDRDVDNLVLLSDGLFQWASTVMSYIEAKRSQGRLRQILENPERYRGLDNLYQGVLDTSSREETDERVPRLLQDVLGSILSAPVPIDATTIAYLCCDGVDTLEETMELIQEEVLPSVASMFIIPKDPEQPITVSHKSVLDYLTGKDRCTDSRFYIDLDTHHERMLDSCFRLMESNLKRDICRINDPSSLNDEVQYQVSQCIPPGLRYACQYWATHLPRSNHATAEGVCDRVGRFSREHLLYWLEALSLLEARREASNIAQQAVLWLSNLPSLSPAGLVTRKLLEGIGLFSNAFSETISTAAAHIYISALPLAPTGTELVRHFSQKFKDGIRVIQGPIGEQWSESFQSPPSRSITPPPGEVWSESVPTAHDHGQGVRCVTFSPDGGTIVSGSDDATIQVWDGDSGDQTVSALRGHTGAVYCIAFASDGRTIVSGSNDTTVRLWDVSSGAQKVEALKGHTSAVYCLSISSDGTMIASGSNDNSIRLWDTASGTQKGETLKGHTGAVCCLAFAFDGRMVASGSYDATVRLWDTNSGSQHAEPLVGHTDWVTCLSFSRDGRTIASGSNDESIRLWNTNSGDQPAEALKSGLCCFSFSSSEPVIACEADDTTARLWDTDFGAEERNGRAVAIYGSTASLNGRIIKAGLADAALKDADPSGPNVEPLRASSAAAASISFSEDGSKLCGKTRDGVSREWDVAALVVPSSAPVPLAPETNTNKATSVGSVSTEGWIFHHNIRWFWVPFRGADWVLCGSRLTLCNVQDVYIIDVSQIMYLVE